MNNKADINFVCTLWASNGMGRVGEEELLVLDKLGLKVNIVPVILEKDGLQKRTLELLDKKYEPSEKTLFYSIPQEIKKYHTVSNYIHIPWDTSKAPDIWTEILNEYCTKVYPCSNFTHDVFKESGVKVPMMVVKHGVRTDRFPFLERDWNGKFVFLTTGDLSIRKGTDILIEAFLEAFPNEKDVELILKSNKDLEWGSVETPKDSRIKVIEDRYDHKKYLDLFKKSHCYVAPSRSEGFCLPALEAMSTGMAAIVHNWGGLTGMANDKFNFPFTSSGTISAPSWFYPPEYSQGGGMGNWGEPDKEALKKLMRFVYEQRDKAEAKGKLASKWVKSNWDWDDEIKKMWKDISNDQHVEKSGWGEFYNKDTLTVNAIQDSINSHKELFWMIRGFYPDTIIEAGTGTGEMAGFLMWNKQEVDGMEPTNKHAKRVIAVDNDAKVLEIAKVNLEATGGDKVELIKADAFTDETKADLIFAQGMLEHLSDRQMLELVDHQLQQAPVVIHSVPNNNYGKLDFGNERLLSDEYYYNLFKNFDVTVYRYWNNGRAKIQTILVFKREDEFKASIIMPIYNQLSMTQKAIAAVRKHTKDYELIVIDNGCDDGTTEWLDKQKDIRTIHLKTNLGVPKPKNLAISLAKGKYICFLDNDTKVGEHWLEDMIAPIENDPTVGFVTHEGYLINKEGHNFMGKKILAGRCDWAAHSVFLFRREAVKELGLLIDKDKWNCEDVYQCCHFRSLGYCGVIPEKAINVIHYGSKTALLDPFSKNYERFRELTEEVWRYWDETIRTRGVNPKLDIGVGDAPAPGYIHVDIQEKNHVEIIAEAGKLPFEDSSIDEIRNSHLIEHFWKTDVDRLLKEWYRVLADGGTLRIICPDIVKIFNQVLTGQVSQEQALMWIFGGHLDKYDIHHWGYSGQSLIDLVTKFGFKNAKAYHNNAGWLEVVAQK